MTFVCVSVKAAKGNDILTSIRNKLLNMTEVTIRNSQIRNIRSYFQDICSSISSAFGLYLLVLKLLQKRL